MERKNCSKCGVERDISEFYKDSRRPGGRGSWCRVCWVAFSKAKRDKMSPRDRQARELRRRYGITPDEYDAMLKKQNKVCAICKDREATVHRISQKTQKLAVDHDHNTGKVRGLLCSRCNKALGLFYDDLTLLTAATEYLIQHKEASDVNTGENGATPTGDPGTTERTARTE